MVNRNTFREAFTEIDAETSDYYVLGFYSSNPDETRRTRRLQVEVDARGGAGPVADPLPAAVSRRASRGTGRRGIRLADRSARGGAQVAGGSEAGSALQFLEPAQV